MTNSSDVDEVELTSTRLLELVLSKLGLELEEVPPPCIDKVVTDEDFRKAITVYENIREVRARLKRYENRLRRSSMISKLLLAVEIGVAVPLSYVYYLIINELRMYLSAVCSVAPVCPPATLMQVVSVAVLAALVIYVPLALAVHRTLSVTKSYRNAVDTQKEVLNDLSHELERLVSRLSLSLRDCVETWRDTF